MPTACSPRDTTPCPLLCRRFKPPSRLKPGAGAQTKPPLASAFLEERLARGVRCRVVLAASRSGERGPCSAARHRVGLPSVGARRSTHGVWMGPGPRLRQTRWRPFHRVFTDGSTAQRFLCATV